MEACKRNTGLTVEQFNDLFDSLPGVHLFTQKRRTATAALFMYLMKMRTGLPTEDIGKQFHVTATSVQRLISKIRPVLQNDLVPQYVNYVRSREELIEHNTAMSNGLFDPEDEKKKSCLFVMEHIFSWTKVETTFTRKRLLVVRKNVIFLK